MRICFYLSASLATIMMIHCVAGKIMVEDVTEGIIDEKIQQYPNCRKWKCADNENEEIVPKWPLGLVSSGCHQVTNDSSYAHAKADLFQQCCHTKAACYQTCGTVKNLCDKQFMSCGQRVCEKRSDAKQKEECTALLNMQLPMLKKDECKGFYSEQESHCECVPRAKATEKREAVITKFLEKHNPEVLQFASAWVKRADEPTKMATLLMKLVGKHKDEIKLILADNNDDKNVEKHDPTTASAAAEL